MDAKQTNAFDSWIKFLDPKSLKSNLIAASIYLAAWETFEHGIIDHVESFYCFEFDENGLKHSDRYKEILARDRSQFRASLLWFKDQGVVDDADLELANRARQHRNEIAHKLPRFVSSVSHNVDVDLLRKMCELLNKIDVWWIRNIEIPTNPDFDDQDVDSIPDSEIRSGNHLFLAMLLQVATGEESEANRFLDEFVKEAEVRSRSH